jgi:regulator of RNase E activity RraB
MKKYVRVYSFQVISFITEGKKVFCIDKEECTVTMANLLSAGMLLQILEDCKTDGLYDRYEFYYVEEGEAEDDNI